MSRMDLVANWFGLTPNSDSSGQIPMLLGAALADLP